MKISCCATEMLLVELKDMDGKKQGCMGFLLHRNEIKMNAKTFN